MGDERDAYSLVDGNLRKTNTLGYKRISGIRVLNEILKRWDGKPWFGFIRPSRLL
jgi:hypothetical protein